MAKRDAFINTFRFGCGDTVRLIGTDLLVRIARRKYVESLAGAEYSYLVHAKDGTAEHVLDCDVEAAEPQKTMFEEPTP